MLCIPDLRKQLHGKYILSISKFDVTISDYHKHEVYYNHDFSDDCRCTIAEFYDRDTKDASKWTLIPDIDNESEHLYTMSIDKKYTRKTIDNGYLTIDDEYGRRIFSVRPDGFHYSFIYRNIRNSFPSMEWDSDGVRREFTEMDTQCLCYESSSNYGESIEREILFDD